MHILLVEDDDLIREYVETCLSDEGHSVQAFPNAASALKTIDAGGRPDLILTDFNLGEEINGDGVDFAIAARASCPQSEVLVISGNPHEASEKVRRAGFGSFLAKPFTSATLLAAVARTTTA